MMRMQGFLGIFAAWDQSLALGGAVASSVCNSRASAPSGQKRRVTPAIKRQMRRRCAIEPVIGHIKAEHRKGRNYLAGQQGDAVNAVLAAAGYNFSLLLRWLI